MKNISLGRNINFDNEEKDKNDYELFSLTNTLFYIMEKIIKY